MFFVIGFLYSIFILCLIGLVRSLVEVGKICLVNLTPRLGK